MGKNIEFDHGLVLIDNKFSGFYNQVYDKIDIELIPDVSLQTVEEIRIKAKQHFRTSDKFGIINTVEVYSQFSN
jgi:prephenate dehydratase